MKAQVKSNDLKAALKSLSSLQHFGKTRTVEDEGGCLVTAQEGRLILEMSSGGAYLRRIIPANLLRPGSVGISAEKLLAQNLSGDVTIEAASASEVRVQFRTKAKSSLTAIQGIKDALQVVRPQKKGIKGSARMPLALLRDSLAAISYPSGVKEEQIHVQLGVSKKKKGCLLDVSGRDEFSYGWYRCLSKDADADEDFRMVFSSDLLSRVIKELNGESVRIGYDKKHHQAFFSSESFLFLHPILDEPWIDLSASMDGEKIGWFECQRNPLAEAVQTARCVGANGSPATIHFRAVEKAIQVRAENGADVAEEWIKPMQLELPADAPLHINEMYLGNFLKHTPQEFPLLIENWSNRTVRIVVQMSKRQKLEFIVGMVVTVD